VKPVSHTIHRHQGTNTVQ